MIAALFFMALLLVVLWDRIDAYRINILANYVGEGRHRLPERTGRHR